MRDLPELLNLNQLFLKLNQFTYNERSVLPVHCTGEVASYRKGLSMWTFSGHNFVVFGHTKS